MGIKKYDATISYDSERVVVDLKEKSKYHPKLNEVFSDTFTTRDTIRL